MRKDIALSLHEKAQEIALHFSNSERKHNYSNESFLVERIVPLSEFTAGVVFSKSSGKQALAFCFWVNVNGGKWLYLFPKDSHLLGLNRLNSLMLEIEQNNFSLNGNGDKNAGK